MTKNEQNRVVAWRLKILRQANHLPRGARCNWHHEAQRSGTGSLKTHAIFDACAEHIVRESSTDAN